jgi:MerR family mercuric resistance operon transcriptional regulator
MAMALSVITVTRPVKGLTIGALARAAGVNVETVRYYARRGLLKPPPKPPGGVRRYPPDTVDRLRFIRRAKQLGFTLAEIRELLALSTGNCRDVRARAERKLHQIEEQLRDLNALKQTLDRLVSSCRGDRQSPPCPIITALAGRERGNQDTV